MKAIDNLEICCQIERSGKEAEAGKEEIGKSSMTISIEISFGECV